MSSGDVCGICDDGCSVIVDFEEEVDRLTTLADGSNNNCYH